MDALDGVVIVGGHSERLGYGATANKAIQAAEQVSDVLLFLEDDWELRAPLDLWPYAALLMESAEIGMVRLGVLNLDIRGRTWAHGGLVYWKLDREPHIDGTPVFTGHPSLRHCRYHTAYGDYPIGLTPGDTELAYAWQFPDGQPGRAGHCLARRLSAARLIRAHWEYQDRDNAVTSWRNNIVHGSYWS